MKRILSFFTVAALVTACNSNPQTDVANAKLQAYKDSVRMAADTVGLAQFQQWKAQNELSDVKDYENNAANMAPVRTVVYVPQKTSHTTTAKSSRSTSSGTMNSTSSNTAMKKKGWSKAAKGAAIGTASGAVLGAVINKKNRAVGGVVGGVLGAAGGYGIGRHMDKKDGRY